MSRLIDVDDRIEFIKKAYCSECDSYNGVRCRACDIADILDYFDQAPTVDLWKYPNRGELPEKREVPYQCLCKIHAVGEVENVFYAALWFDGSHFYMPDMNYLYWEENDYTDIVICWQYITTPKEEECQK